MPINSMNGFSAPASLPQQGVAAAAPNPEVRKLELPAQSSSAVQPDEEQVAVALKKVATAIKAQANDLSFSIDQDTGKTIVKITDVKTGEMIRQIPSAELVAIAKSLDKMQGLLVKQKA